MKIKFEHNSMLSPAEAQAIQSAITDGVGNRDGEFQVAIYLPLETIGYVIHLRDQNGNSFNLTFRGSDQTRWSFIRDAVNGALLSFSPNKKAAGS